jgi:hypothetical protein
VLPSDRTSTAVPSRPLTPHEREAAEEKEVEFESTAGNDHAHHHLTGAAIAVQGSR